MNRTILVMGLLAGVLWVGCAEDDRPGLCVAVEEDIPSFIVCAATDVSCTFFFQTPDRATEVTCDELCGDTTCVRAYDDDQTPCILGNEVPCDETLADGVCECVGPS